MNIKDIHGKWRVISDDCELINEIGDTKIIMVTDSVGEGHNVLPAKFGGAQLGYFYVARDGVASIVLDYNHPGNPFFFRGIKDILVKDGDGWRGVLYNYGNRRFEFRLERVKSPQYDIKGGG